MSIAIEQLVIVLTGLVSVAAGVAFVGVVLFVASLFLRSWDD